MERKIEDQLEFLNAPGTSGTQAFSSSEDDSDSSSDEEVTVSKNLNENYEDEIENNLIGLTKKKEKTKTKKEGKVKRNRRRSKIPVHLRGLMGEANLRFARGDWATAEKMCYELIRQEPHAFEPYQTLSQINESKNKETSIEYLTIAAHLDKNNADRWVTLGDYYCDTKKNYRGAVTCYTRAVRAQPKNYDLHLRRIQLLELIKDNRFAIRCKVQLLHTYSKKCVSEIIALAKELAEHYHIEKDYAKGVEVFSVPFMKIKKHITPELVNMYLELLLLNESYPQCLDVFVQYCNIDIEVFLNEDNKVQVLSFTMPETLEIDLRIKFIICLVKLDAFDFVDTLISPILEDEENVEKNGDLYLDVAEALMSKGKYMEALQLLIPLIKSNNFSLAAVWLKYAECLSECGRKSDAIDAYQTVVRLAPMHLEVRHPLAQLLINTGRYDEALVAMSQQPDSHQLDVELLMKQMDFLLEHGRTQEYLDCVDVFLRRHCVVCKYKDELRQVTFQETITEKITRLNRSRQTKGDDLVSLDITSIREPSIEEEYKLYRSILNFCYKNKFYIELKKFAFYGLCSQRFKVYVYEITIVALYSCLLTRDSALSFPIIRDLLIRKTTKPNHRLWNLFNIAMQNQEEMKQTRFLMRLGKTRKYDFLKVLESCVAMTSGSYRIANMYLLPYLKQQPTPFVYMLLGVTFLQMSCQKYREMKKKLTQCSYGFFSNYANKRGKDAMPEVYYNLGRMYHQYGIMHLAVHYYKLVLEFQHPLYEQYEDVLDLKHEAAYNMVVIYKECENYVGARNIMTKYLTI